MDEFITLISPVDSPSEFSTQFDSTIPLNSDFEVGLKSIFHGGKCNVCEENNYFFISSYDATASTRNLNPHKNSTRLTIPIGFYRNTSNILDAIKISVDNFIQTGGRDNTWFKTGHIPIRTTITPVVKSRTERKNQPISPNEDETFSLKLDIKEPDLKFYQPKRIDNLLSFLGKSAFGTFSEIHVRNFDLQSKDEIGFVYCSLVKSSRLNNKNTNLLAIIPLSSNNGAGYAHHRVVNPTYYPVAVTSFERIKIELRNTEQQLIHIQNVRERDQTLYPTIITLHVRQKRCV